MDSDSILTESGRNKSISKKKAVAVSPLFYWALAGGAVALTLGWSMRRKKENRTNVVAQWIPTVLLLGIYNKIVKTQSSAQIEKPPLLH